MAGCALTGCSGDEPGGEGGVNPPVEEVTAPVEFTQQEVAAARSTGDFDYAFFREACGAETGNIVVSPLSAQMLLGMTAHAVGEADAAEVARVLGCDNLDELCGFHSKALKLFPETDAAVKVGMANAVWYAAGASLSKPFGEALSSVYDGEAFAIDFGAGGEAASQINRWCYEKTNGLIPSIMTSAPGDARAVVANALYMKGEWAVPFEEEETTEKVFHGLHGDAAVDMMHQECKLLYYAGDGYRAVRHEMGRGNFIVSLVLPDEDIPIGQFIGSFDYSAYMSAMSVPQRVELSMPRFRLENEVSISSLLPELGLGNLADSKRVTILDGLESPMVEYCQKSVTEFNEQGAEGGSTSWSKWPTEGETVTEPVKPEALVVNLNRPFIFFINEKSTGACLFAGRVIDL